MSFLNKVGTSISDKSKSAVKKAREMTEISSLHSQISAQEDIVDRLCLEIGKKVYEKRESFPDSELEEKYTAVSNAYGEIERLKTDIILVKGAKRCPHCGIEVSLDFTFCPECGTAVPEPQPRPAVENIVIRPGDIVYYQNDSAE
ncbi:MAG: zinc ribbon domain-containing protein [Lachnospiraceae bacterium]|nr:zinc ribbon domain-containing protein [Lachnospiraceae bacterium]